MRKGREAAHRVAGGVHEEEHHQDRVAERAVPRPPLGERRLAARRRGDADGDRRRPRSRDRDRDGDGEINEEEFLRIMKKTSLY